MTTWSILGHTAKVLEERRDDYPCQQGGRELHQFDLSCGHYHGDRRHHRLFRCLAQIRSYHDLECARFGEQPSRCNIHAHR